MQEIVEKTSGKDARKHPPRNFLFLLAILVWSILLRLYFFRAGLWAWDSGELACGVRDIILPHLPYPGYLAIGILFKSLSPFPIDITLSFISFIFGTFVIIPFYYIVEAILKERNTALLATFLFSTAPNLINESGYQEIYSTQCFFVILSIALLLSGNRWAFCLSAASYGVSITVNILSLLLIPFFILFFVNNRVRLARIAVWFSITFLIESAAVLWTYFILDSSKETLNWWFYNVFELFTRISSITTVSLSAIFVSMEWLVDKFSSFIKSLFVSLTPLLSIMGVLGLYILGVTQMRLVALLLAFLLPYFVLDLVFPDRAISNYTIFFLPVAAIGAAAFIEKIFKTERLSALIKIVPTSLLLVLYIYQSMLSPSLPNKLSVENHLYNMHGFLKWIGENTPENAIVVTEREPWIVIYYTNRAVIYSNFMGGWTSNMSFFPKSPKMPTANSHKTISLDAVVDYLRAGVPVYSTSAAPFGDFMPVAEASNKVVMANLEYKFQGEDSMALYRLSLNNLYLYETFHSDDFLQSVFSNDNLAHDRKDGFVYPASLGIPATIGYMIKPKGSKMLRLKARLYVLGEKNRAAILVSSDGLEYKKIYELNGDKPARYEEPVIDIAPWIESNKPLFLKVVLYRETDEAGPLIDSRLEKLMVYGAVDN